MRFLLVVGLSTVGCWAGGEPAGGPAPAGFTVTVEFLIDGDGVITKDKVVQSEADSLNGYARALVLAGHFKPKVLPPRGSEPKRVRAPVFFPVENYEGNQPLPAGTSKPVFLKRPRGMIYPFGCWRQRIVGGVWVALTIGVDGAVKECTVVKASHPEFAKEVRASVVKWQFKPAMREGQPVEARVNLAVGFQLDDHPTDWQWQIAPEPNLRAYMVSAGPVSTVGWSR